MIYGVVRESNHAGQKTIRITPVHEKAKENSEKVGFISSILNKIKNVAKRFSRVEIWKESIEHDLYKIFKGQNSWRL